MTGGGSSELRSLRSEVQRAIEIYGELGLDLTELEGRVVCLEAELAKLRAGSAEAAKPTKRAPRQQRDAALPRSKAQPRAKARRERDAAQAR